MRLIPSTAWHPPAGPRGRGAARLLVVLVPLVLYAGSLGGDFVQDDVDLIRRNALVGSPSSLPRILVSPYRAGTPTSGRDYLYRPLTVASYNLTASLFGLDPVAFHAGNLVLHVACVLLMYGVLGELLGSRGAALAAALLYAAHPAVSEAVANCSGRGELLAALFCLLAWRRVVGEPARPGGWAGRAAAGLLFLLGLLSKESAIALPAVIVAGWGLQGARRGRGTSLARGIAGALGSPAAWKTLGILGAAAGAYLLMRALVLGGLTLPRAEIPFLDNPAALAPAGDRIVTAVSVVGRYFALLLCPLRLSADYSHAQIPVVHGLLHGWVIAGGLGLVLALGVAPWVPAGLARNAGFGLLLFYASLSVASNVPFPVGTIMAERLLYLPAAGFSIAAASLLGRVPGRRVRVVGLGVLVVLLGARTVARVADWRSREAFILATVRSAPRSAKARFNHGNLLREQGRIEEAAREYEEAVAAFDRYAQAWLNLGAARVEMGDEGGAEEALRRVTRLRPDEDAPWYNLARLRRLQQRPGDAATLFEKAAALCPVPRRAAVILGELGETREGAGDRAGAVKAVEEALARDPARVDLLLRLARYRYASGSREEARDLLIRVLRISPGQPEATRMLRSLSRAVR